MADLKDSWKQAGKSMLLALNDLGISLIDTAKAGYGLAMDWARKDNAHIDVEGREVSSEEPASQDSTDQ